MSLQHLARLKKLMPPLDSPPESVVEWSLAETGFGITFPEDYKEFVRTYGNVIWCDLFRPIYPATSTQQACEESKAYCLKVLSYMYKAKILGGDGKQISIPPYPALGGLLPCLADTNGGYLCWHTSGQPNEWTTALYYGGNAWFFPMGLTQLIADWIEQIPPADAIWDTHHLEPDDYGISP